MDLIDRQAAIDLFQNLAYADWNQGAATTWADAYSKVAETICYLPSAEPDTIYCKDCKFCSYEPDGKNADVYVCNYSRWRRSEGGLFPDDFCSRAEEREDG